MTIKTYQLLCERAVLNKESSLQTIGTMAGVVLKDTTSIINPVLTITQSTIPNFNYLYIEEFSRYYFVDGVSSVRNGLWEVSCSEDVLMSFRSEIENQTVIVNRCSSEYDRLLVDKIVNKIYPTISMEVISPVILDTGTETGTVVDYDIFEGFEYSDLEPVALVNACPVSIQQYDSSNKLQDVLPNISIYGYDYRYGDDYIEGLPLKAPNSFDTIVSASNVFFFVIVSEGLDFDDSLASLRDDLAKTSSPNNVLSIRHYPFKWSKIFTDIRDSSKRTSLNPFYTFHGVLFNGFGTAIATSETSDGVTIGCDLKFNSSSPITSRLSYFKLAEDEDDDEADDTEPELHGYLCYNTMPVNILAGTVSIPKQSPDDWKNYSPYTKYYLWLPFYGYKEIDYAECAGKILFVYYNVDWNSGDATIMGVLQLNTSLPFQYKCLFEETVQISQDIPFNATNYASITAQREALLTQLTGNIISNAISGLGTMISGGISATMGMGSPMAIGGAGQMVQGGAQILSGTTSAITNYIAGEQSLIAESSPVASAGSITAMVKSQRLFILKVTQNINEVEGLRDIIGSPLCEERVIGNISAGFFNCIDFHLTNFPNAWTDELNMIEQQLKMGVIKQ